MFIEIIKLGYMKRWSISKIIYEGTTDTMRNFEIVTFCVQ